MPTKIKEHKIVIVSFALLLMGVILASIFFYFSSVFKDLFIKVLPSGEISEEVKQAQTDLFFLEQAVKIKDPQLCYRIEEADFCLRIVARVSGNADICKEIADSEERKECLSLVAGDTGEYHLCNLIEDEITRNRCQKLVVLQTYDSKICEIISPDLVPYTQSKCFLDVAVEKGEIELCKRAREFEDVCNYQVAVLNQDAGQCNLIKDKQLRNFCFFYNSTQSSQVRPCNFINKEPLATLCVALASLNPYFCGLIKDYQVRTFCKQQLAKKLNNIDLCEGDKYCITKIAMMSYNPLLCNYLPAGLGRIDCKIALALEYNDKEICSKLVKSQQERCYYQLALKTGNPTYCDEIAQKEFIKVSEISRTRCLKDLAQFKPDLYICERISDSKKRRFCKEVTLWDAIRGNQDPNFCQEIVGDKEAKVDEFDISLCYLHTALNTNDYSLCIKLREMTSDDPFWAEDVKECIEKTLAYLEKKYLEVYAFQHLEGLGEERVEDPIMVKVYPNDGMIQLADRAFNRFLATLTFEEKQMLDFEITMGHRIYIEDYLAKRMTFQDPLTEGEQIPFPRKLIHQAINSARNLTEKQLENLSQYTFAKEVVAPELLQNQALSYCDFRTELSYYYQVEDKELDRVLCQIELSGNYELCENFEDPPRRAKCYEWITQDTTNYKVCENFKEEHNQAFCYENFASNLGLVEVCENLETSYSQESCLVDIVRTYPDPFICGLIKENDSLRDSCYQIIALDQGDVSFCEKIVGVDDKKWCFVKLAGQLKEPSLCERIEKMAPLDPEYIKKSKDDCYEVLGKKDPQYCGYILNENRKFMCYRHYYKENKQRFARQNCEEFSGIQRDYCYTLLGEMTNNLEKCSFIEIETIQDYCEYTVLVANNDSRCEMIKSSFFQDDCYSRIAQATRDYLLCTKIESDYERGRCVNNIANLLKSREPCKVLEKGNFFKKTCGDIFF